MVLKWLAKAVVVLSVMPLLTLPLPCAANSGSVTVEWGKGAEPPKPAQPAQKTQSKQKGPPDHAPAHGYRAKHQYRYYPDSDVYFDTARNVYFYIDKGGWRMAAALPGFIHLPSGFVTLGMDSDKPYTYHHEHKAKYPPGQDKKKNKNGKEKSSKKP